MSLPAPRPGLVFRYAFLWSHEADAGADEASKERPCAIVVASQRDPTGDLRVIVAPITRAPPSDPSASIEIPPAVRVTLGLGGDRQWLRLDELNRFSWPGYDLRPVPGKAGAYEYGLLPRALFERFRDSLISRQRNHRSKIIPRN
jgi:hypothetical protein